MQKIKTENRIFLTFLTFGLAIILLFVLLNIMRNSGTCFPEFINIWLDFVDKYILFI